MHDSPLAGKNRRAYNISILPARNAGQKNERKRNGDFTYGGKRAKANDHNII